jgi:flagellar P-ring protein precursor FlgI
VRLSAVSILHGDLSIEIATDYQVSQPAPFSNTGQTAVVPDTTVEARTTKPSASSWAKAPASSSW